MQRARVLSSHVVAGAAGPSTGGAEAAGAGAGDAAGGAAPGGKAQRQRMSMEKMSELMQMLEAYRNGKRNLVEKGELPDMSLWDLLVAVDHEIGLSPFKHVVQAIDRAAAEGSAVLRVLDELPGPWWDAKSSEDRAAIVRKAQVDFHLGYEHQRASQWQLQYGDRGLGSNIAVPFYSNSNGGPVATDEGEAGQRKLAARVLVCDPEDAERISRTHVRKEAGSFQETLYDSIISTTDNEHWRAQRRHLAEVFLPLSSLGEILPVSRARAKLCAERLADMASGGRAVDMSDFLLHEAQAQLQLALLGAPEEMMEASNESIRAAFMGDTLSAKPGELGKAMKALMQLASSDETLALPTDGCPVRGPLSKALRTSDMPASTNYGNMLLVLFAGHDTTGHTMTWLLFELARHPEIQRALHGDVDRFFSGLGGRDIEYRDLSSPALDLLDRCITETLRLWPAVANGTFRQLQFDDVVKGPGGVPVTLPRGTAVNIGNWSRHRNPDLWGPDADRFNPHREFDASEMARVGCPMAAANPQSTRYSPFAHAPRNCLGRNFAQMEMRLIMAHLLRAFEFSLAPPYDRLVGAETPAASGVPDFRGVNRGTMGPMDLERTTTHTWGTRYQYAMKMFAKPRA